MHYQIIVHDNLAHASQISSRIQDRCKCIISINGTLKGDKCKPQHTSRHRGPPLESVGLLPQVCYVYCPYPCLNNYAIKFSLYFLINPTNARKHYSLKARTTSLAKAERVEVSSATRSFAVGRFTAPRAPCDIFIPRGNADVEIIDGCGYG